MEEAAENGKESSHSAHANGIDSSNLFNNTLNSLIFYIPVTQ
jgi:hypothetical protein